MDYKFMLALMVPLSVVMVAIVVSEARKKPAARPPLPPPPTPSRTSALAGLSFFSGLVAIMTVTAAGILASCVSMGEVTGVPTRVLPHVELASQIVLYASLLPAVMAVALALAARGGISESRGLLMGRSLYRTGMLLGILSGVLVFNGKVLNPASWGNISFSLGGAGGAGGSGSILETEPELDRGWLGVEHDNADNVGVRILRVVPGSPADRAGVLAGDWIVELDGAALSEGPSLPERIGALKPGTRVRLGVRRGNNQSTYTAELAAPFASLLALITDQSHDDERLTVLKAAGSDRRYTSDELAKICRAFDFDDGRLKVIEPALPLLTDPQNAYLILGSLTFSDAKKKVSGWIAERAKSPK